MSSIDICMNRQNSKLDPQVMEVLEFSVKKQSEHLTVWINYESQMMVYYENIGEGADQKHNCYFLAAHDLDEDIVMSALGTMADNYGQHRRSHPQVIYQGPLWDIDGYTAGIYSILPGNRGDLNIVDPTPYLGSDTGYLVMMRTISLR